MIKIDSLSTKPIYEQIYDEFVKLIVLEVLKEGEKLPSVRELALMIQINPNTIQKSFKQLESNRFIKSVKGKGNFVNVKSEIFDVYKEKLESDMKHTLKAMLAIGIKRPSLVALIDAVMKEVEAYDKN